MWQRKHRQYQEDRCNSHYEITNYEREEDSEFNCWDNGWDDDLRETFCINKNNMSVSDALKKDLECGWSSAHSLNLPNLTILLFFTITLAYAY